MPALKSGRKATWQHANPCKYCIAEPTVPVVCSSSKHHSQARKQLIQLSACQEHSPMPSRKQASTDLGLVGMRAAALALFGSASAPAASQVSSEAHTGAQESRLKVQQGRRRKRHRTWESAQGRGSEYAASMCACRLEGFAVMCWLAAPCSCPHSAVQ
jgi:hypothetical protein